MFPLFKLTLATYQGLHGQLSVSMGIGKARNTSDCPAHKQHRLQTSIFKLEGLSNTVTKVLVCDGKDPPSGGSGSKSSIMLARSEDSWHTASEGGAICRSPEQVPIKLLGEIIIHLDLVFLVVFKAQTSTSTPASPSIGLYSAVVQSGGYFPFCRWIAQTQCEQGQRQSL